MNAFFRNPVKMMVAGTKKFVEVGRGDYRVEETLNPFGRQDRWFTLVFSGVPVCASESFLLENSVSIF